MKTYFNSVYIMAPSWVSTSISMFLKSQKAFLLALEPSNNNNNNNLIINNVY